MNLMLSHNQQLDLSNLQISNLQPKNIVLFTVYCLLFTVYSLPKIKTFHKVCHETGKMVPQIKIRDTVIITE